MADITMVDAFAHILPRRYFETVQELYPRAFVRGTRPARQSLVDLEMRFRIMDGFPGYAQVLTLGSPPVEMLGDGSRSAELAKLANDGMAELCRTHPDRFVGFAAALPLHQPDAALAELERTLGDLGALGVQIHTHVRGAAWDEPRFAAFWAAVERLDRPVWVHPARVQEFADYEGELASRYGIYLALGWPYETAVFMTRLVFSGVMDRHPRLRILTHHAGGLIPHFAHRIGMATGPLDAPWPTHPDDVTKRAESLYRRFYGDTALYGYLPALRCGLDYFGADRILFGTDMPYDESNGLAFVRDTIQNVKDLGVNEADRQKIFRENARRVLGV